MDNAYIIGPFEWLLNHFLQKADYHIIWKEDFKKRFHFVWGLSGLSKFVNFVFRKILKKRKGDVSGV